MRNLFELPMKPGNNFETIISVALILFLAGNYFFPYYRVETKFICIILIILIFADAAGMIIFRLLKSGKISPVHLLYMALVFLALFIININ